MKAMPLGAKQIPQVALFPAKVTGGVATTGLFDQMGATNKAPASKILPNNLFNLPQQMPSFQSSNGPHDPNNKFLNNFFGGVKTQQQDEACDLSSDDEPSMMNSIANEKNENIGGVTKKRKNTEIGDASSLTTLSLNSGVRGGKQDDSTDYKDQRPPRIVEKKLHGLLRANTNVMSGGNKSQVTNVSNLSLTSNGIYGQPKKQAS